MNVHVQQIYLISKSIHHWRFVWFPGAEHFVKQWNMLRSRGREVGYIIVHMDWESGLVWNVICRHRRLISLRNLKWNYRMTCVTCWLMKSAVTCNLLLKSCALCYMYTSVPLCKRHPRYTVGVAFFFLQGEPQVGKINVQQNVALQRSVEYHSSYARIYISQPEILDFTWSRLLGTQCTLGWAKWWVSDVQYSRACCSSH